MQLQNRLHFSSTNSNLKSSIISSVNRIKLLCVLIDGRLDFHNFVSQIGKRAGEKYMLYLEYIGQNKRRILMKAYDFSVLWLSGVIFHRNSANRVNKIHERDLKLVFDDNPYLGFDELLKRSNQQVYQISLQFPATEILKVKNGASIELTEAFFCLLIKNNQKIPM